VIVLLGIIGSWGDHSKSSSPSSYGIDASSEAEKGREAWIENAKAMGVFLKVGDSQPFAYVGPAWWGMTFEQKQKAAGL
jgi:hypothetical protein